MTQKRRVLVLLGAVRGACAEHSEHTDSPTKERRQTPWRHLPDADETHEIHHTDVEPAGYDYDQIVRLLIPALLQERGRALTLAWWQRLRASLGSCCSAQTRRSQLTVSLVTRSKPPFSPEEIVTRNRAGSTNRRLHLGTYAATHRTACQTVWRPLGPIVENLTDDDARTGHSREAGACFACHLPKTSSALLHSFLQ